jgi:hypothetical protein
MALPRVIILDCNQEVARNEWTILHPGEYILMSPGAVHAVLSPINSAIAGWYFVKEEWVRSEKFRSLLMWEMDMIEHRLKVLNES